MRGRLDKSHLAPEPAHGLGHLRADRSTAQYQQAPRHGLHTRHLAVGPDSLQFGQARERWHDGVRAGRQDDVPRAMGNTIHLDHAGPGEAAGTAQQIDPLVRQPAHLAGVGVVRDHEVAIRERRLDVDRGSAGGLARPVGSLTGAQQRLGWNARPVGALAARQLAFDHGDPESAVGQLSRAVFAG